MSQSESSMWPQVAIAAFQTGANLIGKGSAKKQFKYSKKLAHYQNELNRANAQWAYDKDLEMLKYRQMYDSPESQMQRYREAGLNPNLIYGQGTPGNIERTPTFPNVPGVNMQGVEVGNYGTIGTEFAQARLMAAQTDLTRVKTDETVYRSELLQVQKQVMRANPYLQPGYLQAVVTQMRSVADMKKQERDFMLQEVQGTIQTGRGPTDLIKPQARGYIMMEEQMQQLMTKHRLDVQHSQLQEEDKRIKAQIFQSKEFENDLKKIQVRWMQDAEITPQHIYQAIFMLLQSMMR